MFFDMFCQTCQFKPLKQRLLFSLAYQIVFNDIFYNVITVNYFLWGVSMLLILFALILGYSANVLSAEDVAFVQVHKKLKNDNLENVFVQRWAWYNICDFAYASNSDGGGVRFAKTNPFDPAKVPAGSVIFATAYTIEEFLEKIHPKIKNPYILLTLYYGPVFGMRRYVEDPKIIAWFGQVNREAVLYDKFTVIPLGVLRDDALFENRKNINDLFIQLQRVQKNKLLYMNFTVHQGRFDGRGDIYNHFKNKSFCTARKPNFNPMPAAFIQCMKETAQHKFVISPEGDMHDCYRHWESLLVGSIPVVHTSPLDPMFEDLPVVIVEDYKQVTEEFLNAQYNEMKHRSYNYRKLYMQYWVDKINTARAAYFKSTK